jgi:hypothetical protein
MAAPSVVDQGKEEVVKLCRYFTTNRDAFLASGVKEAHVRQSLIDPLFEALGWDVRNKAMIAPQYREVIPEDSLDVEGQQKAPDYTFRVGSLPKFYAEAKKCGVNIGADPAPAFQLRRYGWSAKLGLSILTDFEELGVYDCTMRPRLGEKASYARIKYFHFDEYPDRWSELWDVFSREAVWSGAFDQYVASKRKRGTSEVDEEFLKEMEGWRLALAGNIALRNKNLSLDDLNAAVQLTIDRVVFLRMAEDRGLEPYEQLLKLCERPEIYSRFMHDLSRRADQKYNSGLFHFQKESGVSEEPDRITPKLEVDDKVFKPILQSLYFAYGSPYHFGVMPVEILGTVYERFLGKVIRLTAGHQAKVEEKPEVRKAGGVYYTPAYIVEYIVKHTVAQQIEGRSPAQLAGSKGKPAFRVLDMACGSGSFLLGAYKHLLDYCLNWYAEHKPENYKKAVYKDPRNSHWRLTIEEKKRILTTHLFGVDIDRQAIEVTKLSLLLKVLEGETDQSFSMSQFAFGDRALPNLADNIKCGNSLIGSEYFTSTMFPDPEEMKHVNAFDWGQGFPDAMKAGGFDSVIGNPPFGADYDSSQKTYFQTRYAYRRGKPETYLFFMERGVSLLRTDGRLGFITPNAWLTNYYGEQMRRFVFENAAINHVVDLEPTRVFQEAVVDTSILVLTKDAARKPGRPVSVWQGTKHHEIIWRFEIKQAEWETDPEQKINLQADTIQLALLAKIESSGRTLDSLVEYSQGVIPYKTKHDGARNLYISAKKRGKDWLPLIESASQIQRYYVHRPRAFIRYGRWLWCAREPRFFSQPKILFHRVRKKLPKQLVGGLDTRKAVNRHSLSNLILREGLPQDTLMAVLGLFNSVLGNWWFAKRYGVLMEVGGFKVARLPLPPRWNDGRDRIVTLVDSMLRLHEQFSAAKSAAQKAIMQRQIEATDRQIDQVVYQLYGLTEQEITLIENG